MQPRKYPIRLPSQVTVDADGTGYVRSEIMKVNRILDCQSLAFRNRTGARGHVEIYIKQGASLIVVCDQTAPEANRWYWYPYPQTIKEGEQFEAQQEECIAGDVLDLHIIGHITFESKKEGKPAVSPTPKSAPRERRTPRVELPFHPGRSKSPCAYEV
ncbi:hypothetical protein ES703_29484 [subsurface metagenome]